MRFRLVSAGIKVDIVNGALRDALVGEVVGWHNSDGSILLSCLPPIALALNDIQNLALGKTELSRILRVGLVY